MKSFLIRCSDKEKSWRFEIWMWIIIFQTDFHFDRYIWQPDTHDTHWTLYRVSNWLMLNWETFIKR